MGWSANPEDNTYTGPPTNEALYGLSLADWTKSSDCTAATMGTAASRTGRWKLLLLPSAAYGLINCGHYAVKCLFSPGTLRLFFRYMPYQVCGFAIMKVKHFPLVQLSPYPNNQAILCSGLHPAYEPLPVANDKGNSVSGTEAGPDKEWVLASGYRPAFDGHPSRTCKRMSRARSRLMPSAPRLNVSQDLGS